MFIRTLWNYLFFGKMDAVIALGRKRRLEEFDLPQLPDNLNPRNSLPGESAIRWHTPRSLILDILKVTFPFWKFGFISLLSAALFQLLTPLFVNRFISVIESSGELSRGLWLGAGLAGCAFASGMSYQHFFFHILRTFQSVTNVVNKKIFVHSLNLSFESRAKIPVGDIVNHMSSDTDSLSEFPSIALDLILSFLVISGATVMLFYYLGWSALGALLTLILLAPITKKVAGRFTSLDEKMMKLRDERVTLMSQILNAIRLVKYFAWEKSVIKEVSLVRDQELKSREELAVASLISTLIYVGVSSFVVFVALATHVYRGFELSAALIFTCVSIFEVIEGPFGNLSKIISGLTNGWVAAGRVSSFLRTKTNQNESLSRNVENSEKSLQSDFVASSGISLSVRDLSFTYENSEKPVLENLNFEIAANTSVAIVGPVGAGKSTLLLSLMDELRAQKGKACWSAPNFRKAYVPQEAYIINDSIRKNLEFSGISNSDEEISQAIEASCMSEDLLGFAAGLNTEIGEKGINLSGGQKQRLALARACLAKPQVVFLDDPLSAVDVETENKLLQKLVFGKWQDITRIVVTHRLSGLERFDQILFVQDGKIVADGTFEELINSSSDFRDFIFEHQRQSHVELQQENQTQVLGATTVQTETSRITVEEDRETGAVNASVYWDYVRALTGNSAKRLYILSGIIAATILASVFPLIERTWLAKAVSLVSSFWVVSIYGGLGILSLSVVLLCDYFWMKRGLLAGKTLHDQMLESVIRARVRFFDSTPVGRVIQRFSRDVEAVDVHVQWSFETTIKAFTKVVVSLLLIVSILPAVLIFIIPVGYIYYWLQKSYRASAREAKRMDSVSRSPRYSHFKETLLGLTSVRQFRQQEWFMREFYSRLEHSQRMFFGHFMINRWFSSRIPLIGAAVALATTWMAVVASHRGWITAGVAGLVTTSALGFWDILNWGIRVFADLEAKMTSLERVKSYSNLEQEPAAVDDISSEKIKLSPQDEKRGRLEFVNVKARYASHLPWVLKGISFSIQAGQKIGIIGRTGSGKSTLFQVLFRFVEIEEGDILIDGISIKAMSLESLRKTLAIIPQDPTLFLGSLRSNLDRYSEFTDQEIFEVLKQAGLLEFVKSLPKGIHAKVEENGNNFSQGQRQLFCLARALLIRAPIIVLDEATASVDVKTDSQIQEVLRKSCQDKTILMIAHRLGTVRDSDKIIELSQGLIRREIFPKNKGVPTDAEKAELQLEKAELVEVYF